MSYFEKLADQLERLQEDRLQLDREGSTWLLSSEQVEQLQLDRDQLERLQLDRDQLERLQLDRE